jgi:hypothetical protein
VRAHDSLIDWSVRGIEPAGLLAKYYAADALPRTHRALACRSVQEKTLAWRDGRRKKAQKEVKQATLLTQNQDEAKHTEHQGRQDNAKVVVAKPSVVLANAQRPLPPSFSKNGMTSFENQNGENRENGASFRMQDIKEMKMRKSLRLTRCPHSHSSSWRSPTQIRFGTKFCEPVKEFNADWTFFKRVDSFSESKMNASSTDKSRRRSPK